MNGSEDPLVTLAEQRREDVLAHLLAPEVISAVATRQIAAVEIYPVGVRPTVDAVSTGAGTGGAKLEAPLQSVEIDLHRFYVKCELGRTSLTERRSAPNITRNTIEWKAHKHSCW